MTNQKKLNKKAFSFFKGFSFLFQEDDKKIEVWFSAFSGLEKVYVNGVKVSSQRNFSTNSTNRFKVGKNEYSTNLQTINLLKGPFICTLSKNGKAYKRQKLLFPMVNQQQTKLKFLIQFVFFIGVGVAFGMIRFYWQLPDEISSIFLLVIFVLVFIFSFKNYKGKEPVIEEDDSF